MSFLKPDGQHCVVPYDSPHATYFALSCAKQDSRETRETWPVSLKYIVQNKYHVSVNTEKQKQKQEA